MAWFRQSALEPLPVAMSGIKLGDRLLVVGTSDIALMAALAVKAGLTGRACVVDEADAARARAAEAVEREGALIESVTAPFDALPFAASAFDVVVLRNVLGLSAASRARAILGEAQRVVRPGGRCILINGEVRGGLSAWLGGARHAEPAAGVAGLLTTAGFKGVRTLAEREGLTFIEGVRPGPGSSD